VRVLFVCTGNSARSQMAEGFARALGRGRVEAFSAGTEPRGLNPHAVAVMAEAGIDISRQASKPFSLEVAEGMDVVVTVCGDAEERCPVLPPGVKRLHWPLPDPARAAGSPEEVREVFRRSRDEIARRVAAFLAEAG
jgi:arsenate reductase